MLEKLFLQITAPDATEDKEREAQDKEKRKALHRFREAVREDDVRRKASEIVGDGAALEPLLSSSDAKVRKSTAALLGDLKIKDAAAMLYRAYEKEKTLFVRGTLLKALGQTDPYPYLPGLKERYDFLCSQEPAEEEKKHVREELHALEQILRSEGEEKHHTFIGWEGRHTVLLTTNFGYSAVTAEKTAAVRKKETSLGVQAIVEDLREIVKIRTFRELLFPVSLGKTVALGDGPQAFGEAAAGSKLVSFLERCHKEAAPFYFRIDMRAGLSLEERSRYVKRAAAVIEEKTKRKLINAPDDYEFEIRILLDKAGKLHMFLKMFTIPMERFSYRKGSIASSIHPSLAALLLELAKPYLKEEARILDPCCGVGTMLIERDKLTPAREICGIDIFGEAVELARENAKAAGIHASFIHKDYRDFTNKYLFDEIIANMPVRGKRTKEEHDLLYEGFFHKSEELLAPEGIMILYSNENGFVKKQLRLHASLRLQKEYLIREKEQFWLFIISRRKGGRLWK